MPVSLWWAGPAPGVDEELLPLCDRLVVNSEQEGPAVFSKLQRLMEALGPRKIVTDLAWTELTQWRELLARLFDPPETRQFQRAISSVEVRYSRGSQIGHPLLLVAWLAAAFGWEAPKVPQESDVEPLSPSFQFDNGRNEARIVPVDTGGVMPPGGVLRVEMRGELNGEPARFLAKAEMDGACAEVSTELPGRQPQQRMVPIAKPSWATLLSGELDRRRPDRVYQSTLDMVVSMVEEMRT
jgi:glucose-6-phosphate dehydrogenase assembly protein OpcA